MRVCDIVNNSVWYDPRVKKQIEEYHRNGVDLYVVGLKDNRFDDKEVAKIPANVEIVDIDSKYYSERRTIFTIIKREYLIFKRLCSAIVRTNPDVIHANDLNALIPAYYASKKLKCGLIYDSHEIWLENFTLSKFQKRFYSFFERKIVKRVDLFISVSNAAADYFAGLYRIARPMVITNCVRKVDDKVVNTPKANSFEVLNHGQFYQARGYDTMLMAAQLNANPEITYVIRGRGSLEQKLRQYKSDNNINNARIDPPVKVEELIPMAAKSHIGVVITEPFCLNFKLTVSNKIFEYAAAGLPIVMSDVPEHRYLNDKYSIGIILKENTPECLNNAINVLYSDRDLYQKCRCNVFKMSNELNWEREFNKLLNFEKKLYSNK